MPSKKLAQGQWMDAFNGLSVLSTWLQPINAVAFRVGMLIDAILPFVKAIDAGSRALFEEHVKRDAKGEPVADDKGLAVWKDPKAHAAAMRALMEQEVEIFLPLLLTENDMSAIPGAVLPKKENEDRAAVPFAALICLMATPPEEEVSVPEVTPPRRRRPRAAAR